ncbi:octopamine receptor-like [Lytechinus pictus]|uniref:octopamine receptor-like n=1 Tax=Lytechinus pictus TaxID=7653 RepID=UPI0030BA25FC
MILSSTSNPSYDMGTEYDEVMTTNTTGNVTNDEMDLFPTPRYVGRFLQTASMTFIFVAALLGNILVILLCIKKPKELRVSRRLILHLAILNLCMTVLVLPSVIVSAAAQDWVLSNAWCMATGFFKNLFCVAIILNLVLISGDRYFSVVKPLHYHSSVTVKHHGIILGVIWFLSTLVALPPLIGWNKISYHPSRYICTGNWSEDDASYTLFIFLLGFVTPFLLMVFVYWTIYRAARRLMKRKQGRRLSQDVTDSGSVSAGGSVRVSSSAHHSSEQSGDSRGSSRRISGIFGRRSSRRSNRINVTDEWKIAKTGVIVMASFVICWLPYYIVLMVDAVYGFGTTVPLSMPYAWFQCFAIWMALSSSAVNPYVYVLRSPPMRKQASKAAHNVLSRCRQCCEEDSRDMRRRQSGKTGRYSFLRMSSRFNSHKKPTKKQAAKDKHPEATNRGEPEAEHMMQANLDPKKTPEAVDQIDGVPPNAEIELVSHRKLDV